MPNGLFSRQLGYFPTEWAILPPNWLFSCQIDYSSMPICSFLYIQTSKIIQGPRQVHLPGNWWFPKYSDPNAKLHAEFGHCSYSHSWNGCSGDKTSTDQDQYDLWYLPHMIQKPACIKNFSLLALQTAELSIQKFPKVNRSRPKFFCECMIPKPSYTKHFSFVALQTKKPTILVTRQVHLSDNYIHRPQWGHEISIHARFQLPTSKDRETASAEKL